MNATRENFPPSVTRQWEAIPSFSTHAILLGLSVRRGVVVDDRCKIGEGGWTIVSGNEFSTENDRRLAAIAPGA